MEILHGVDWGDEVTPLDATVYGWALATFGHAELPDTRLRARLLDVAVAWAVRPHDTIPQACGKWGQTKGAYRFLENERVSCSALIASAGKAAAQASWGQDSIVVIQDTSTLSYSGLKDTEGLGPINDLKKPLGMFLHSTLALRMDGRPLGLLHQQIWCRKEELRGSAEKRHERRIEDKESCKWLKGIQQAREHVASVPSAQRPRLIHVMDREGDIHDVLQTIVQSTDGLILRCDHNRRIEHPLEYAHAAVRAAPLLGTVSIEVPRTHEKKARTASVEVRAQRMQIVPNNYRDPRRQPLAITLVELVEVAPPEDVAPLHWRLWTTEPAATLEEALNVARCYSLRWRIEDLHLVLKSGCAVEKLQLETADRLAKAVVLYSAIAVRILHLRDGVRQTPESPCTEVLQASEWRTLWTAIHKQPPAPQQSAPTLRQAVLWIGRLGGHLNRKGDGMPGVRTLWRGWRDLMMLTELFVALRPQG
jgi:hypothetical protein